jgi:protein O-mannosyl-transferase
VSTDIASTRQNAARIPRGSLPVTVRNRDNRELRVGRAQEPRRSQVLVAAALLVAAGAAVFFNSLNAPFVFDDVDAILENPHIRQLWPLTFALGAPAQSPVAGRPLVSLSLAVNYALGGVAPWGYHAGNLAVHVACALLLFGIVRRTLHRIGPRAMDATASLWLAFACALLWLVHPLQTEVVDYVTQRTEAMMGVCYFATLYAATRAMSAGKGVRLWTIVSIVSCAVGMTAKESMVTAPIMVLLYDVVFQAGSFGQALRERRRFYGGLFATWIVLVAILIPGPRSHSAGLSTPVSPWIYALNQAPMILRYLRLSIWPSSLVLDYGPTMPVSPAVALPGVLVVFALLGVCGWAWRRSRALGFLGAWVFLTLAPTSSVVPIATEVGAERRMYLPLAALIVLAVVPAALALTPWLRRAPIGRVSRVAPPALLLAVAMAFAVVSVRRNAEYHDPTGIWETAVARRPNFGRRAHRFGRSAATPRPRPRGAGAAAGSRERPSAGALSARLSTRGRRRLRRRHPSLSGLYQPWPQRRGRAPRIRQAGFGVDCARSSGRRD